jgi:hypothetical protein
VFLPLVPASDRANGLLYHGETFAKLTLNENRSDVQTAVRHLQLERFLAVLNLLDNVHEEKPAESTYKDTVKAYERRPPYCGITVLKALFSALADSK